MLLEIQSNVIQLHLDQSVVIHSSLGWKILSLVISHHSQDTHHEREVFEDVLPYGHYHLTHSLLSSLLVMLHFGDSMPE